MARKKAAPAPAAPAQEEEKLSVFTLPHALEISGIRELYGQCRKLMERAGERLTLDAGNVTLVDTAGIQLLVCLLRSLKARGCEVTWENYSVQIYQVAAELGLEAELGN